LQSVYQWLPAEYNIADDGEVTIESYINNLDRTKYPNLYLDIAKIFRLFVPLIQRFNLGTFPGTLQVVTKAANYILKPGQEYEGSWHVEGMPHEKIIASCIYYYSTSPNVLGNQLAFRELRDNSAHERGRSQNLNFHQNLGHVETPKGRCLVFTNDLQHKVKRLWNSSEEIGARKILCFFVVDPGVRVKSSLNIPPQQWDKIRPVLIRLIDSVTTQLIGRTLPKEVFELLLSLAKWGFTWEEAKQHRLQLMQERKYYIDENNRRWERSFSYCEH